MCAAAAGAGDAPTLEGLLRDVDGDDPEAREVALRARDGYNPKDLVVQRLLQLRPFKNNPREAADLLSLLARVVAVAPNRRPAKQRSNSRILACCYRAYTLDPKNERARVQLGWELYHRKEYSRVLALAREAPDSVKAVAALAEEKLKSKNQQARIALPLPLPLTLTPALTPTLTPTLTFTLTRTLTLTLSRSASRARWQRRPS